MRLRPLARLVSAAPLGFLLVAVGVHADGEFRRFPAVATPSAPAVPGIALPEAAVLERRERAQPEPYESRDPKGTESVGPGATRTRWVRMPEAMPVVEAPAAEGDEARDPEGDEAAPEAKQGSEVTPPTGCMYRDATLIWEKVPGTCKP